MLKALLFVAALFSFATAHAQTTIVTCGTTFYDSGGPANNYPNNALETYEICPGVPGEVVSILFTAFDLENCCDYIEVFNGMGTYDYLGSPERAFQRFTSTAPDGCLTVRLETNGSITAPGFTALSSCAPPSTCAPPSFVYASATTATTLTLEWSENGTATLWDVYLSPVGGAPSAMPQYEDVTMPYTITGLAPDTEFSVFVRADCDGLAGNNESFLSDPGTVGTEPLPPANDDCAGAISVTLSQNPSCSSQIFTSTRGSSVSPETSSCGAGASGDVWYTFTPTTSSVLISATAFIDGVFGVPIPFLAEVYAGTCAGLASLGCGARATNLTPGTTYYLRLDTRSFTRDFQLCLINGGTRPSNDACAGATTLTVNPGPACTVSTSASTASANQSLPPACGGASDDDVWFGFTALSATHILTFSNVLNTGGTSGTDLYYEVFTGGCGVLTQVDCGSYSTFDDPVQLTGLTPSQSYVMRVYTSSSSAQVNFDICLTSPPANDDCAGALALPVNPTASCTSTVAGSTVGASRSGADCGAADASDDIWFSFTATGPTHLLSASNVDDPQSGFFPQLYYELLAGTCASNTVIDCASLTLNPVIDLQGLTTGQTYLLRVFVQDYSSRATFDLCLGTPPANDECTGAFAVPVNPDLTNTLTTAGTSFGATRSYVIPNGGSGCDPGANDDDVWYSFQALATEHRVSILNAAAVGGSGFSNETNAIVRLFDAGLGCAAPTELGCGFLPNNAAEKVFSSLTPGNNYFLSIQTLGESNDLTYDLSIKTAAPLPVTLISFAAKAVKTINQLTWTVAEEVNFAYYEIQRSTTGQDDWQKIHHQKAIESAQHTGQHSYEYKHHHAPAEVYYRLVMVDLDGSRTVSDIVHVRQASSSTFQLFPNPSTGHSLSLKLDTPGHLEFDRIEIRDALGRLVYLQPIQAHAGAATTVAFKTALPPAIYTINLHTNTNEVLSARWVVID